MKMAQKALQTVETDTTFNPGTPQERIDAYKALLRSNAYSVMGAIDFKKNNFASAQTNLQKSIDAYPSEPDAVVVLQLAIALDKQDKYPDALKVANRAVELTQHSSQAREVEALGAVDPSARQSDNEQFEFLGDAVLGLVTTEALFHRFPGFQEGHLSKLRAHLVGQRHLLRVAEQLEIGHYLRLG